MFLFDPYGCTHVVSNILQVPSTSQ
jgi:hypothetical protein